MSDEPAQPEQVVGGGDEGQAAEAPTEPQPATEPTTIQEPEMAAPPAPGAAASEAAAPEAAAPEAAEPEAAAPEATAPPVEPKPEAPEKQVQEEIKTEPSATAKPTAVQNATSEFPLADAAVLSELKGLEARAREAAKAIEVLKEQLAASTKKDVMTKDDIQVMEQKQKELMDKMQEFEDITKKVQQLVGLVDVASSQLGPPQKPMVPPVEGPKTGGPATPAKLATPNETLPKVIICGTNEIDEVPKIIVCEPTSARNGKQPLYHQIKNETTTGKEPSKTKVTDSKGPSNQDQTGKQGPALGNQPNYTGQGYPQYQGGVGGDGNHMGMMQGGMMGPGMMCPGLGQVGMMCPAMGQAGMMPPGMGQAGMMPPGMMQPGMGQQCMMQPGMGQGGMMQLGFGQGRMMNPGMGQQNVMQPWMLPPGMMQAGLTPVAMGQSSTLAPAICCNQCGRPKKQKNLKTKDENAGLGQSSKDAYDMKKGCRKRKQCYCQISGLCQLNKPPFPTS